MAWVVLIVSAVFEAVWATALGQSDGFTRLIPMLVFAAGLTISLGGLSYSMQSLPVSVAYSVWVGIGAALTVTVAMLTGNETASPLKIAFIAGIVGIVIGLKVSHKGSSDREDDHDHDAVKP